MKVVEDKIKKYSEKYRFGHGFRTRVEHIPVRVLVYLKIAQFFQQFGKVNMIKSFNLSSLIMKETRLGMTEFAFDYTSENVSKSSEILGYSRKTMKKLFDELRKEDNGVTE